MSGKPLKILFVIFDNFQTERLGIQILSTIAREEGFDRRLLILNRQESEEALREALDYRPEIVAYSAMTFEQYDLQKFNRSLKNRGLQFISIFGGHHYTFSPEEIHRDDAIDVICRGEGEAAFRQFIRAVREGTDYRRIPNLLVRDGNAVVENPLAPLITDLDSIPFPDRNLLPLFESGSQIFGRSVSVMFGRGCPNQCTYCYNSQWNRLYRGSRICRHRTLDNVLREIKEILAEHQLDFIYFHDDNFALLPREVIAEFCRRYPEEVGLPFFAQFRAEFIDEELVVMLKRAGLFLTTVGVECGDEEVAATLLKRGRVTNQDIIRAFDIFNKHKLRSFSQNMACFPIPDPLETDLKTIRLNIRCRPTWASFAILIPIPHTEIWKYAIEQGYLEKDAFDRPGKLPSVFTRSRLDYHNPRLSDRLENLHKFASITVRFPFLLPLVRLLIKLPPNPLFQYLHFFWYGYWNTVGLFRTKLSFSLIWQGLKTIRQYRKKH